MSDNTATINKKWQKWVLTLGKLILCILLPVLLAELVWQIIAPNKLYLKAPSQSQTGVSTSSQQRFNTAQYHLFGEVGIQPVAQEQEVDAPDTRLNLTLLGITFGRNQQESSAIIASQNGDANFYRVKDKIEGRTLLSAVYEDRVILDTNGNLETLKFTEDTSDGIETKAIPRNGYKQKAKVSGRQKNSSSSAVSLSSPTSRLRERYRNVATPAEFLNVTQQMAQEDPERMISDLGLISRGSGEGYQVQSGSMLESLNLRPGDVILSVNGQRLGDLESDKSLLGDVSSSGSVRLEIQRDNQRFVINHQM